MELTQTLRPEKTPELKKDAGTGTLNSRVTSIDILRSITMLLMIFVNDLWSLTGIPEWLEHAPANADAMGLADTVFPAFLFIVGMSVPYAIDSRRKKGENTPQLVKHVLIRTVALLVMGVFLVNGENMNAAVMGISRGAWNTFSCISFILIWNAYPKSMKQWIKSSLQGIGITVLITLAILYRGGDTETPQRFATHWWGILGLIGWCYLSASLIAVFARNKFVPIAAAWLIFCGLSMLSSAGMIPKDSSLRIIPSAIIGGTLVALTLGGVLTGLIFQHFSKKYLQSRIFTTLLLIALGLLILGLVTNKFWDISKIRATAPWLFLCSSFTILGFLSIYWIADVRGKASWFSFIKPAGTNTLLCYLIPYFAYALTQLSGVHLPAILLTGTVGLLKSFVFALLCIWIAGLLVRMNIRLRL